MLIFRCGQPNEDLSTKIVGGTNSDVNEYPWQVSLYLQFSIYNLFNYSFYGNEKLLQKHFLLLATYYLDYYHVGRPINSVM